MILKTSTRVLILSAIGLSLQAAPPVAWAKSNGKMTISGVSIPSAAGSSPVSADDEVVAIEAPVLILLEGGGRVALEAESRVRLTTSGPSLQVHVQQGRLSYEIPEAAEIAIYSGERRVSTAPSGKASAPPTAEQTSILDDLKPPRARTGSIPPNAPGFRPPSPSQPCSDDVQSRAPQSACQ